MTLWIRWQFQDSYRIGTYNKRHTAKCEFQKNSRYLFSICHKLNCVPSKFMHWSSIPLCILMWLYLEMCVCAQSIRHVGLYRPPMDCSPPGSSVHGVLQAKYWSGLPFSSPRDLPDPGIEPMSPVSPVLASRFYTTMPPGKPVFEDRYYKRVIKLTWGY